MILGTHITQDSPENIHPNKTSEWLSKHNETLKAKFPGANRFTQKRLNLEPNSQGFIEVEWTAHKDN